MRANRLPFIDNSLPGGTKCRPAAIIIHNTAFCKIALHIIIKLTHSLFAGHLICPAFYFKKGVDLNPTLRFIIKPMRQINLFAKI